MENFNFLLFAPLCSFLAIVFAGFLALRVMKRERGNEKMQEIAEAVKEGARAYLKRQYSVVAIFFALVFLILLWLSIKGYLVIFVPFAFLTGGFFSGLAGYIGMNMATNSSDRTANAARSGLNNALRVAFSGGAVMGFVVVGLGLLDLSIWYWLLNWYYSLHPLPQGMDKLGAITSTMLCFGMGASSQALFARVGGGIFTKAADVGADLVGKMEAGIPEDDPRNPAVIADNVGDNVGDVAGMGADLYESYVGSIVATMALAVSAGLGIKGVTLPMVMAGVGVIASIIGTFFVNAEEKAEQGILLKALRKGIFSSALLIAIFSYLIIKMLLGNELIGVYWAVISGLLAGIFMGISTEFFTSDSYSPTRFLSRTALTGPATLIIGGLSIGMLSTAIPVVIVASAILLSFYLSGGLNNFNLGLYGIGISAVGMLSTLGITLASDAYGPIADNAGGNAQMSGLGEEVRKRTDALDALGNTTAATGKGFAIGSAALTALALIVAYKERIESLGKTLDMNFINPRLISGLFVGGMLPFLFCSLTLGAVGRAAGRVVEEVRRQFKEIKGLMEGKAKADYGRCVNIVTKGAQKEMILPSLLAIFSPLFVGIFMGLEAEVGLLCGALVSGFILAIMMANSGGSWDNAKKYIEKGNLGGKGSFPHKASIVGDTVGDPFKDTAGPSLNILIKLMSMVSIVFASFIIANTLFK
ncbi:MAG: sodium-translocating pyrophosphatase [Candidatus Omnitrophica bacterium]|nr:sodium-translocating pyrophosphatase [Candidatus Omnitrophota bacterium]MCM8793327.1 sodium-translocating pyrophosphatase [Candidatus Omnitrophota bacterium]